jgi:Uncharacterized protein with SCP/PR1 domains
MALRRSFISLTLVAVLVSSFAGIAAASTPSGRAARARMLHLVNGSRHANGRSYLGLNYRLSGFAWQHTTRMAAAGSLYHTANVWREVRPFGAHAWGENVGVSGATFASMERAFMASPAHRRNILSAHFHHIGIGVRVVRGTIWVTLDFYG